MPTFGSSGAKPKPLSPGTEGSNPALSSEESANHEFRGGRGRRVNFGDDAAGFVFARFFGCARSHASRRISLSKVFLRQFDTLYREGETISRVMAIAVHPFVTGQPHRIAASAGSPR
jgi:hypothetical protein